MTPPFIAPCFFCNAVVLNESDLVAPFEFLKQTTFAFLNQIEGILNITEFIKVHLFGTQTNIYSQI